MSLGNLASAVAASVALLFPVHVAFAQQGSETTRVFDRYHLTAATMYDHHAYDHALILWRLATSGQPMPASILKEHADAIRANLQASANSLVKVSGDLKTNRQVASGLTAIQARLTQLQNRTTELAAATNTAQVVRIASDIGNSLNDNFHSEQQLLAVVIPAEAPAAASQREWPSDLPYTD